MDFVTNSEYLVWLAKWIGIISFALVALIAVQILVLRVMLIRRQKRTEAVHETWRPVLIACLEAAPEELPNLARRDITSFLVLWNYFNETVKEVSESSLNAVARRLSLDEWSLHALVKGSIREKLLAIQTLGWLQDKRGWNELVGIMESASPVTSLCAAKALMRIDPDEGILIFVPQAAVREHWSYSTVGKILKEAGPEIVTNPLIETAKLSDGPNLVRLLRFMGIAYEDKSAPLISKLLRTSKDVDVVTSCLRAVSNPDDLLIIRQLLGHEDWRIRTQAAICLGHIGTEEDIARLTHSSGDQQWWVRYRSALALAKLPTMTTELLQKLADEHQSAFGSDIINKVRMEKEAFL